MPDWDKNTDLNMKKIIGVNAKTTRIYVITTIKDECRLSMIDRSDLDDFSKKIERNEKKSKSVTSIFNF